jgi:ABC-type transporter Mla maintaining outer membrane lipid asymmetry ATPase subunit MlaF
MQKRVSFARSVLYDPEDLDGPCRAPELILLDEPTAVRHCSADRIGGRSSRPDI